MYTLLPNVWFIIVVIVMVLNNENENAVYGLLFTLPFLLQLNYNKKVVSLLIGVFLFCVFGVILLITISRLTIVESITTKMLLATFYNILHVLFSALMVINTLGIKSLVENKSSYPMWQNVYEK